MICPLCKTTNSKILASEQAANALRRHRRCVPCGIIFTTYEHTHATPLFVVKANGEREPFSRAKLATSIRVACGKSSTSIAAMEQAAERIEAQIASLALAEVTTSVIRDLCARALQGLNQLGFERYTCGVKHAPVLKTELGTTTSSKTKANNSPQPMPLNHNHRTEQLSLL